MDVYEYSKLSSPGRIRLLQLLPHQGDSKNVRCTIFETALRTSKASVRPFEALSYCWGSPDKTFSLTIVEDNKPGRGLKVTENLYAALLRFQDPDIPRIMWIDAICIDQGNKEEKGHQIHLMAEIYATASRVIVWLGESADGSDNALIEINDAAASLSNHVDEDALAVQKPTKSISALLERPWFRRIWVLQEVAAARQILVVCGSIEVDGHAFCLGLNHFQTSTNQVALLMQGAIFRPRRVSNENRKQFSLDVGTLAEMLCICHGHEATEALDKVYALFGMCSDGDKLKMAGVEPDYNLDWKTVIERIIKFIFNGQAYVDAWVGNNLTSIRARGSVLGHVHGLRDKRGSSLTNVQRVYIMLKGTHYAVLWTLRGLGKPIQEGDIICYLQGSSKPTIIRPCEDYFEIVAIAFVPLELKDTSDDVESRWLELARDPIARDFTLVWHWKIRSEGRQGAETYEERKTKYERPNAPGIIFATRVWEVAQILGDSGFRKEAFAKEMQAHEFYTALMKADSSPTEFFQGALPPLIWAAEVGADAEVGHALLRGDDPNQNDILGRTALGLAAINGHNDVVMLLLKAGADINFAGNRHKDGVKIFFNIVNDNEINRVSLFQALGNTAKNEHDCAVRIEVIILREIGKRNILEKSHVRMNAAEGQESLVKMLIKTVSTRPGRIT